MRFLMTTGTFHSSLSTSSSQPEERPTRIAPAVDTATAIATRIGEGASAGTSHDCRVSDPSRMVATSPLPFHPNFRITTQILAPGGGSVAGLIANNFGEAGEAQRHALVAAGLALFVITLIVNTVARIVVNKTSKGRMED